VGYLRHDRSVSVQACTHAQDAITLLHILTPALRNFVQAMSPV
jgi:hypothetical protein